MILRALLTVAVFAFAAFVLLQVLVPAWRGTSLFPLFRRNQRRAAERLVAAKDHGLAIELDVLASREEARAERLRNEALLDEFEEQLTDRVREERSK